MSITFDDTTDNAVQVAISGDWLLREGIPSVEAFSERISGDPKPHKILFDTTALGEWDTCLITVLIAILHLAKANNVDVDKSGLPSGVQRLITLAFEVTEREGARRALKKRNFLSNVGEASLAIWSEFRRLLNFIGELERSISRFISGKATYQRSDIALYSQEAGAEALPIVSLISFLIGMIFAFVGVMQLNLFGAGIYTANLVAVGMVREMAAIMTAIIMAGRTGASYAAQIGTMKVNEEIDALTTLGINPVDFLVTPRMIALVIMMPLLTMYSSLMGIVGGMAVSLAMLDVSLVQYVQQTINAVHLNSLIGGLFKSIVYGSLVALAGCLQGISCGNSAMAVGQSTTKAVVMGIVLIVVSAAILTVIYINLGI
ncbi:ABC transporter permease [Photobacterium sp. J15]|uniref:ABC transporter permease n=1 Tax=Photobacterium sp. J15 TaxID=265901 RepID=UPI0007E3E5D7|nr:ABC transporter permease [Photobacterium sp. J15]